MKIRHKAAYSFDDVLLVPRYSEIASRQDPSMTTQLGRMTLKLPLLSSNMDTVTEDRMAIAIGRAGGAGVLHRFADLETQTSWIGNCYEEQVPVIVSIGITGEHHSFLDNSRIDAFCVDVAHGDHSRVIAILKELRADFPETDIIAGNVATGEGAKRLADAGANIIKVGIGPGSVCSTRVVSGHGFPQLSAIEDVDEVLQLEGFRGSINRVSIVADGGIRYPGDIVKALAAGADAVMLGSLLAGTDEAAGARIVEHGVAYKTFRGMASLDVQRQKREGKTPRVEGVTAKVPYRGPVGDTLDNLEAGIRSGLSYSGANSLASLRNAAEFVVVTGNTLKENHPHHPYRL